MLVKLESKNSRVKSLAFHPKRPWILAALHTGAVQIWDYRMGTLVDEYKEHEGPVRGCAFHSTQPLFASCGDDYTVKVYNYRTRKCLFTLAGHMDYVRSVAFHPEAPWLMSASDDQTIRIWNWQSRQCVSVLTGHAHYVMCAQFHLKEDLVVSASLDQTIRVWDISGLRRKGSSLPGSPLDAIPSYSPRNTGQLDLFAPPDGSVKYILEGHDRGVNWVCFHPIRPLIVSSSDDRTVKIWRYNDIRAWELETLRGHQNNVSSAIFHPKLDYVLSDSEDKTMKIWDISSVTGGDRTKKASVTFKKDSDRYWCLACHPESNLFAAGHDSGFTVFKLERERPAYVVSEGSVYYFHEKVLKTFPLTGESGKSQALMTADHRFNLPAHVSHNPAEEMVLISNLSDNGKAYYELFQLRTGEVKKGTEGAFGVFTARNRFAILDVSQNTVHIKSIDNSLYRSFTPPITINRILPATAGSLLLVGDNKTLWWDLQQGRSLFEVAIFGAKYVSWSLDNSQFSLMSKNALAIVNRSSPENSFTVDDSSCIKSAVWEGPLLFYTNSHHLKYVLPNGEVGVICTIDRPYYLLKIKDDSAFVIDRTGSLQVITIDPSEFMFKLALLKRDFVKVMEIIQSSPLVGQAIIAYLRQHGFAEIALEFVRDSGSRFELAIECGRLDIALGEAENLDTKDIWLRLGEEATLLGELEVAEAAYKKGGHYEKLSFLLLITGQHEKLLAVNEQCPVSMRIQNDLCLGAWGDLCKVLHEETQVPALAYLAAKQAGDSETADLISRENGGKIIKSSIDSLQLPHHVAPCSSAWPLINGMQAGMKTGTEWLSAKSLVSVQSSDEFKDVEEYSERPVVPPPNLDDSAGWGEEELDILGDENEFEKEFEVIEQVPLAESVKHDYHLTLPGPGKPLVSLKGVDNLTSLLLQGNFEEAKELLQKERNVSNWEPMMDIFERIVMSSSLYFDVGGHYDRSLMFSKSDVSNPEFLITSEYIKSEVQKAMVLTTNGHFKESLSLFKSIIASAAFVEKSLASELIEICRQYIVGLSMELSRRELEIEDAERSLELSVYFTHCGFRDDHQILALRSALTLAYKMQCVKLAGKLARRLLDCNPSEQIAAQAKKVISVSEKTSVEDPIKFSNRYDPTQSPFNICPSKFVQVTSLGSKCQYCHYEYGKEVVGLCSVCQMSSVQ